MRHYKKLLLNAVQQNGWQLELRLAESEWWAEEHWIIRSIKENYDFQLFLSFLIDQHHEGDVEEATVSEITASTQRPQNRLITDRTIAYLSLYKGHFDVNLSNFILAINSSRRAE